MEGSDRSEAPVHAGGFSIGLAEPRSISLPRFARSKEALMKIVLLVVGPLFIAVGLFWFGQGTGLLAGPHNAVLIDAGAGAVALGICFLWFAWR
jgi:hypothetical protein